MSESVSAVDRFDDAVGALPVARVFALAGTVGLLASFLVVLYDIVGTVGDPLLFYPVVMATILAATILSRILNATVAVAIGALLLAVGLTWHVLTLDAEFDIWVLLSNNIELLTGETVLRIQQADVWALTVTPTPVFLTWYFALRRRYVGAAIAGGGTLAYLVLTGDAGSTVTLLGVVSAAVVVAFGEIETTGWSGAADQAVVVLAVMVLVPLVVTIVPGGAASPIAFIDDEGPGTMEESVVSGGTSLDIVGEVNLSPESRFTVTSEEPRLWRVNSYDRYTGDGWIQTGDPAPLGAGPLDGPPGPTRELRQEIETDTSLDILPTAWQPVAVEGEVASDTLVGPGGGLTLDRTLTDGETFEVRSEIPDPERETLVEAGRNYPESVRERYTQLPQSTPDRIGDRTEQIAQNADSPFETAVTIEQWLERNRDYSLTIDRPEGDIADSFLFEMDAGYCTYFATTMVTMLRSQDIPARMATGYTPGQPVGENEYAVRGLNSHAWVEVYFPDIGWVEFDPTPGSPRQEAEQSALEGGGDGGGGDGAGDDGAGEASDGSSSVNSIDEIGDVTDTGTEDTSNVTAAGEVGPESADEDDFLEPGEDPGPPGGGDGGISVPTPSREQMAVSLVAFAGLVAWTRQAGVAGAISRRVFVRFQRRADPATDVERAYERLLLILEDRHRPRETGETMRQYLADIYASEDVRRVVELYEQARYAEDVTEADADEAIELVDSIRKQE
jgi:transglutaminase-like putative cysteine protease